MVFGEINAFLSVAERASKLLKNHKEQDKDELLATRFVRLFEAHDVHRNQIPRFFKHGLKLADVIDDQSLQAALSEKMTKKACKLFNVRREWLDGADDQVYNVHLFDGHPERYQNFLNKLLENKKSSEIHANLVLSSYKSMNYDAVLILKEEIGQIGEKAIYRNYVCGYWTHKHWKSRADLTACIAITLNMHINIKGRWKSDSIDVYCTGKKLLSELRKHPICKKMFKRHSGLWHPDMWVFDPGCFLNGVDNKVAALERVLEYFAQGLMETGYSRECPSSDFSKKLTEIK